MGGGATVFLPIATDEIIRIGETACQRDLGHVQGWGGEERAGFFQAKVPDIRIESGIFVFGEEAGNVVGMDLQMPGHVLAADREMEMFVDELAGRLVGEAGLSRVRQSFLIL